MADVGSRAKLPQLFYKLSCWFSRFFFFFFKAEGTNKKKGGQKEDGEITNNSSRGNLILHFQAQKEQQFLRQS